MLFNHKSWVKFRVYFCREFHQQCRINELNLDSLKTGNFKEILQKNYLVLLNN